MTINRQQMSGKTGDSAILAAEAEMTKLRAKSEALMAKGHDADELHDPIWRRFFDCGDLINRTEPDTLVGAAAKLRYLADPDIGIAAGDNDGDVVSVVQLSALLDRLTA